MAKNYLLSHYQGVEVTVGGDIGHRACPAFQIRSDLVNQALHALPMSKGRAWNKMAGGPCQQLRYFTENQTGRNHLGSADNHGLPLDGHLKSTWPNHIAANQLLPLPPEHPLPFLLKTLSLHSQSLWSTSTLHLQGWVSTRKRTRLNFLAMVIGSKISMGTNLFQWVSSGTFAGTCECNTEGTFPLRAQGKQWAFCAFNSIAQPHVEKTYPKYEIDTEESRDMRWRRNGVKEWEEEN